MKIKLLYIVLFWILFAVVMTGVMIFVHPITNHPVNIWNEFLWELGFSLVWMVGTPVTLWISRIFSIQKNEYVKNGAILFSVGIILSVLLCVLHGFFIFLSQSEIEIFELNILLSSLFYNIDKMLIVYCALVIMQHAMDFYQRFQDKELAASKLETQLSQAQMLALKMQLQPHFLFNTLNAIVTLVHKDANLAEEMIVRLSDFLRITLDSSGKQIVSLKEELEFINAYLLIEKVRFGGRLSYQEHVPAVLLDAQLPMLILQPLVENAIKHGFSQFADATILEISAEKNGEYLKLSVIDDAAPPGKLQNISEGIGITNTRNRLQTLYGGRASLCIEPNDTRGVCVQISIPFSDVPTMNIRTLIVDDEPLARERIQTLLQAEKDISIVAECGNGQEALQTIIEQKIDLVLLDIQMPELDGIRLLEKIPFDKIPMIIFITAFDSFAVKAFELNAVDYLLKPFTKKRFHDALERVKQNSLSEDKDLHLAQMMTTIKSVIERQKYSERIIVKTEGKVRFIPTREILWFDSDANYLNIHTQSESLMIRETMTNIIKKIDPSIFLRIHRTVIVNTEHIKELKPWFNDEYVAILRNGTQLPIGRTYRKAMNDFFKL